MGGVSKVSKRVEKREEKKRKGVEKGSIMILHYIH